MSDPESDVLSPIGSLKDINPTAYDWIKKFESKSLSERDLRSYWAEQVPALLSPELECDCLNIHVDEETFQRALLSPMEHFITDHRTPQTVFEELKKLEDPPRLCGKVFKMGEPTYSCRDCGLDATCVLCVYCFKSSEHRLHRYKMSMSSGGGYCDCGDKEAWKTHPFCQFHLLPDSTLSEGETVLSRLPVDLVERLTFVLRVTLKYCHQMLTWERAVTLPPDLQPSTPLSVYATVLYNDEIHTYDQVIQTLIRSIECSNKQAIEYATITDREGRSIVKVSDFSSCTRIQSNIERITSRHANQPLKTVVMHAHVVSHQIFAMRLLCWLQQTVSQSEGFRLLLSNVIMEELDGHKRPLLEAIMLVNTDLWKAARNQWHQLFIQGMLMDTHAKKIFAKVFTRNYPELMGLFTADDHDHSVSVTSLSVQIFTVPTLAHHLMEHDSALATLIRTFLSEAERYRNQAGKLAFERTATNVRFRRAQYVLYDIKYLLTVVPSSFTDSLKKNFLYGFKSLLTLLTWMQGMDAVVRQVGTHVEFEAEWESGINLQFKLFPVVDSAAAWCASERSVLIKGLRAALKLLASQRDFQTQVEELANHSVAVLDYDTLTQPVSVHLPLSRLLTTLLLQLGRHSLTYDSFELSVPHKPSPVELMELPLRCLVLVAQFRLGMWRRNGYSLLNQVYFYHNVRLREEMFDRDIQMLQICASLIESNEFVIHLLNKFGLMAYAKETKKDPDQDSLRQLVTVSEEFLQLLLTLVSERHYPGIGEVTEKERIQKEIIQLLCMEAMPHSVLLKMLPKDSNEETGVENVIGEIADFKKPLNTATGKYELKGDFYHLFNPFFYHYSQEDRSKAQEVQLKRRKQAGEEEFCPPPLPPPFSAQFATVAHLMHCDVTLHYIKLLLSRTLDPASALQSETQLEKLLHLIGVALWEEERAGDPQSFYNFTGKAYRIGILDLLEECLPCPRVETQKELLKWVIRKFRHCLQSHEVPSTSQGGSPSSSKIPAGMESTSNLERKKNSELAAQRRAKIMMQMSKMQKNFIRKYADLFEESETTSPLDGGQEEGEERLEPGPALPVTDPVAVGNFQRGRVLRTESHTCILCREDQEVGWTTSARTLVMSCHVQNSTVLSQNRGRQLKDPHHYDPLFQPADLFCGPHASTCSHVMHSDCWIKFFDSVVLKERRRPLRYGRHVSFNVDKNEFLCPLCERLSNTVIPLLPPLSSLVGSGRQVQPFHVATDDWLTALRKAVQGFHLTQQRGKEGEVKSLEQGFYRDKPMSEVTQGLPEAVGSQLRALFDLYLGQSKKNANNLFPSSLTDMMKRFSQSTFSAGLNVSPESDDDRGFLLSCWCLSYTIQSMEWLLRDQGKPLFGSLSSCQDNCLSALSRSVAASTRLRKCSVVQQESIRLLRYLLLGEHYLSNSSSLIEVDAFGLMVELSLSLPSLFLLTENEQADMELEVPLPLGNCTDHFLLTLMYTCHLAQVLLTAQFPVEERMEVDSLEHNNEEEVLLEVFYHDLMAASGLLPPTPSPSSEQLKRKIREGSLPFLRSSALYYHYLTDVAPPEELKEPAQEGEEYQALCRYLDLPTSLGELFQAALLRQLAISWARHPRIRFLISQESNPEQPMEDTGVLSTVVETSKVIRHPIPVNQLMDLPEDYSELINSVSMFLCPNSEGDDCRSPTLCLVCASVLCAQSYCCQTEIDGQTMVGACTSHAISCTAGTGIFLRIRDCKVIFLASMTKGCYMSPPYVDDYGETDQGLLRGNPLHLCRERYKELHRLWLSHSIPEQIAHALELSTSLSATNWQLM